MSESDQHKLFEIISVYFSNTYFNSFYDDACKFYADGKFKSIDKAYIYVAESFHKAINQPKTRPDQTDNYTVILKAIVNDYNKYLGRGLNLREFNLLMYKCIIPNYDNSAYSSTYSAVVQSILVNTIGKFTVFVINKTLPKSVSDEFRNSNHKALESMNREWKEIFKSMLIDEKSEYAQLVIAERNGVPLDRDRTSAEIVEKLEARIRKLIAEKNEIITNRNNLAGYVSALLKEVRDTRRKNEELLSAINSLQTKPVKKSAPTVPVPTPDVPEQAEPVAPIVSSAINDMLDHRYDNVDIIDPESEYESEDDEGSYSDSS